MQQNEPTSHSLGTKPDPKQLAELVNRAIATADAQGFKSYRLYTTVTTNSNGLVLSPILIQKGTKNRNASFGLPNVFAPILADTKKAAQNGTVFHTISDTHICINDKYPIAPTHVLLIPKAEVIALPELSESARGELFAQGISIAIDILHLTTAVLSINVYPPLQEVPHIHLHILSQEKIS